MGRTGKVGSVGREVDGEVYLADTMLDAVSPTSS